MASRIIYLSGRDGLHLHAAAKRQTCLFMFDSFSFMSVCPRREDVRYQGGTHGRNCGAFVCFSSEER